jgi:predicted 3-demethylubiquinone-9 3-methyltransferase (glyoxalase superfamily)
VSRRCRLGQPPGRRGGPSGQSRPTGIDEFERRPPSDATAGSIEQGAAPMPRITPNLWFDTESEEAAEFYVSVFPNSSITNVFYYGEAGPREAGMVLTVDFVLDGQEYTAINGGPEFTFNEAISLLVNCADQAEVDYYWDALSSGGEPGPCGWLKDKFGVSWQIVPDGMEAMLKDPDSAGSQAAMRAMLGMQKIDLAALQAAFDGA